MGFSNPTKLKVGQQGVIFGHRGTVMGRSVLRSADGYRWDEYHLQLDDGTTPTLVYESGIWKRFDLFDPDTPLSADAADDCEVGDQLTLRGRSATLTYVGRSRVQFIEGTAPEGYRVGSQARYFNAEAGGRLFVVSWTGKEVEDYEGQNLPRGAVERAFGLPAPALLSGIFSSGGLDDWFHSDFRLAAIILGTVIFFGFLLASQATFPSTSEPPVPVPAPALHLLINAHGNLDGHHYVIAGHRINEIAEMPGRFGRHEYDLMDEQGGTALLVQGLALDAPQWYLLRPASGPFNFGPDEAATLKVGARVRVGEEDAVVRTLFLSRTIGWDGDVGPSGRTGSVRYGFTAQTREGWALVRWDATSIEFQLGRILSREDVEQAFGAGVSY